MWVPPVALALLAPVRGWSCSACFGASDSPLAVGFNMGILSLLAVTMMVLGGIATFFIYLARRSAGLAAQHAAGDLDAKPEKA